ncbi:MAG: extracellular solute-binding protein [Clostridia bacterium]|nr:extracellular solute-binding protein [Clostridia bacterium]
MKTYAQSLMLLMLGAALLVGCGGEDNDKPSETAANPGSQTESESVNLYGDNLPAGLDFGGREFRVATYDGGNLTDPNGWYNYIEISETNGDILNDAAYLRNTEVEERFNVTIKCYEVASYSKVVDAVQKSVTAGDDDYDLVVESSEASFLNLISSNMLYDVNNLKYIDLSQSYYTKNSYKTYEIGGHRYLFSGTYTYPLSSCVYWLFNKDMWAEYDLPDLYQTVRDGAWTMDTLFSYLKGTYRDVNGNSKKDMGDKYGFSTTDTGMLHFLYPGLGMSGVSLTEDGFTFDYSEERAVDVLEAIIALCKDENAFYHNSDPWGNFFNGNSLMMFYGSSLTKLRDLEFDFGVVPMPKFDEAQENYASYMCGGLVCIPSTISDPDCVGAVTEALFSASARYTEPAYIDKFVENKVLRDADSVEMYRMMLQTATYDFTRYISPNANVAEYGIISSLVQKKSTDLSSAWAKIEKSVKTDFEAFYDEFTANS